MSDRALELLTFNCWGLKYVSKLRKERLRAIADELAKSDYDIIALQEVWVEADWQYIVEQCKAKYPHKRFFKAGMIAGPGLAILSKIPIESTFLYRFPINGRPSAFYRGDWLVGKSIAVTILKPHAPGVRQLAILNSHMHAPYAQTGDASYSTHRACQAWDLAKVVKVLQLAGFAVVQVGDLNSKPGSLPYKLFTLEGGLEDSWNLLHGEDTPSNDDIADMSPQDQISKGGITCDSRLNTWRASRQPWEACRLDYALIDKNTLLPVSAEVRFTKLLPPPLGCSYSDHFAYSVKLIIRDHDKHFETPVEELNKLYAETIEEVRRYIEYTIPYQFNWRMFHFVLSLLVVIAIQVAISFASSIEPWASVLFSIASTVIGITGFLNGMICFLGVRSEKRALEEVIMEVKDSLNSLQISFN